MTKHEEYNLAFNRAFLSNGITRRYVASTIENNPYESLTFMNALELDEIQYFIDSISLASKGQVYDPNFYKQQGTEACWINFNEPNLNIDGLTINMVELQLLLQEWQAYLNS